MSADAVRVAADGTVRLAGALTFDTAMPVSRALAAALGSGGWRAGPTAFDLGAVTETDSAGLALLVHWRREAERAGGEVRFEGAPAPLRSVARLSGVEALLFG